MSDFELNFLLSFRIWIEYFTMLQILKESFLRKIKNHCKKRLKKNNFFGSSHTVKTIHLALSCCIEKLVSDSFLWKKERFYQSNFSSSFTFWNKILKTRQILGQDFQTCHILRQHFKICLILNWNTKNVSDNQV